MKFVDIHLTNINGIARRVKKYKSVNIGNNLILLYQINVELSIIVQDC